MTPKTPNDIFTIPMPLSQAAIETWIGHIIAETDQPIGRVQALSELQDCQALHATPLSPLVVRSISVWLERVWHNDAAFVDAAATLTISLGVGRDLLERTRDSGSAGASAIAVEALEEWNG
ncbi:MAG: hypothetical protein ACI9OJ_001651 [Myxococcota bacterium]|jgi:hypothetical protein